MDLVWYCSSPLGHNTLENMLPSMTSRAGIKPHLTNHLLRATTVTVLSAANIESRYIRAIIFKMDHRILSMASFPEPHSITVISTLM